MLFIALGSLAQGGGGMAAPPRGGGGGGFGGGFGSPLSLPAGGTRGPMRPLEAPSDAQLLMARFQATIYEVQPPAGQTNALDPKALARQAATTETFLKALGEVGKARVLYRMDQPVNVFSDTLSIGSSEPVITATRMTDTGQAINSVSYQNVGAVVRLIASAQPGETGSRNPDVTLAVQVSTLGPGDIEIGPAQKRLAPRAARLDQTQPLAFDQPSVMLAVSTSIMQRGAGPRAAGSEKPAAPVIYVMRYNFGAVNPASGLAKAASSGVPPSHLSASSNAAPTGVETESSAGNLPAQFQATVYEVHPVANRADTLDAGVLAGQATSADTLLKALADAGTTRVQYDLDQPVNVISDQAQISTNEAMVTGTQIGPSGQPINTITYMSSGFIVRLAAHVPSKEMHGEGTNVAVMLSFSMPVASNVEIGLGQTSKAIHHLSFQHGEPLAFGKPRVALVVGPPADGDEAKPTAYVVRYMFSPPTAR